jgi:hypothetical protein
MVVSSYAYDASGATGSMYSTTYGDVYVQSPPLAFVPPFVRTEYYTPDVPWGRYYDDSDGTPVGGSSQSAPPTVLRAGIRYDETWNAAVHGPFVGWKSDGSGRGSATVTHEPERLSLSVTPYSDAAGHFGHTAWKNERTTLYRNGVKVGEQPYMGEVSFNVPSQRANYRMEIAGTRLNPLARLSTQLSAAWTFASQAPNDGLTIVPTTSVRFTPKLDLYNRTRAGVSYVIPLTVDRQPGVRTYPLMSVNVDVSYDDGKTWTATKVNTTSNGLRSVTVQHPNRAGFVSLRARTKDFGANTFEETIIRAYEIR